MGNGHRQSEEEEDVEGHYWGPLFIVRRLYLLFGYSLNFNIIYNVSLFECWQWYWWYNYEGVVCKLPLSLLWGGMEKWGSTEQQLNEDN